MRRFRSPEDEYAFTRTELEWLLQKGYDAQQMVVLHRHRSGVRKLRKRLGGLGVEVATFHALKGLEFEVVFLSQMQHAFPQESEGDAQAVSEARRLVYMAMTRARERLYLNYEKQWPRPLEGVRRHTTQATM